MDKIVITKKHADRIHKKQMIESMIFLYLTRLVFIFALIDSILAKDICKVIVSGISILIVMLPMSKGCSDTIWEYIMEEYDVVSDRSQ